MSIENRAMTGIRPTGELTVANFLGAMQPIVDLQEDFDGTVNIFVADLHGLTDQEPDVINHNRLDTARTLLAAGVDTSRMGIYLQSQVEEPTVAIAGILDRHTTVAELSRIPTLKEKLRADAGPETATLSLFRYPVLMAADIIVQDANVVPVGKDQEPHIEFTRDVVRRFNNEYGKGQYDFVQPQLLATEGLRILALNGKGKMSKSVPNGALFLKDTPDAVARKVRRAQTANPGEGLGEGDVLASHFRLTEALARPADQALIQELKRRHADGEQVMGEFKPVMIDCVNAFLADFQERYESISDREVVRVLHEGGEQAMDQSQKVLTRAKKAMGFVALPTFDD
jgi:tryptophanyl-tRNA synthetase